jgi:uncharacterized membrane protein YhaH (DUF805 family)
MIAPLQNYATFTGRARRAEYWWFVLFNVVVATTLLVMTMTLHPVIFMLLPLQGLAMLVPSLAVTVRRLHDIGRSGSWAMLLAGVGFGAFVLLAGAIGEPFNGSPSAGDLDAETLVYVGLLTFLGLLVLQLVWFSKPSQPFENRWGPNPCPPGDEADTFS